MRECFSLYVTGLGCGVLGNIYENPEILREFFAIKNFIC